MKNVKKTTKKPVPKRLTVKQLEARVKTLEDRLSRLEERFGHVAWRARAI